MRALPQIRVYGGILGYDLFQFEQLSTALVNFQSRNNDPKAQVLPSYSVLAKVAACSLIVFYDAPMAPENMFKEFTDIHPIGTLETRSYLSLVQATPIFVTDNMRSATIF